MASFHKPVVPCPVCHRRDHVKSMQTAYEEGSLHIAPPPLPEAHASMVKYIGAGMALVGVAVFLSIVILATSFFSWLQMVLTLVCVVAALVLSFLGIRQNARADEETRRRYPLWDQAMANWMRLRFCARDRVVFDYESNQILSGAAVKALLDLDRIAEPRFSPDASVVSHEASLS